MPERALRLTWREETLVLRASDTLHMNDEMADKSREELIEEVAELITKSKRIIVFTGAGISTESGLPDFRSPGGLWTKFNPDDFTYQKYLSNPETRKKSWQMFKSTEDRWIQSKPNLAHHAVAEMERLGKLDCVITQNVDGLHQKAGNSESKVIQLHGNIQWVRCLSCDKRYPLADILGLLDKDIEVPECDQCGGILKTETISFGQPMPVEETSEAQRRSTLCDLCIVIGSSLVVYPAALMPQYALESGAKVVIINEGPTGLDNAAHVHIQEKAGMVMKEIMEMVEKKLGSGKITES